jgi:putative membrane protein
MISMRRGEQTNGHREGDVLKGLAAGLIGGLVASWVMEEFQAGWTKMSETLSESREKDSSGHGGEQDDATQQQPATVKAAEAISEGVFGHELTPSEKEIAGPAVHYALGAAVGGLYGAVVEIEPDVSVGAGLPFGAVFWLVVDEGAGSLLGLSKGPTEYPVSTHVYALASHLVYGLTTDIVRRVLRRTILH